MMPHEPRIGFPSSGKGPQLPLLTLLHGTGGWGVTWRGDTPAVFSVVMCRVGVLEKSS